MNNSSQDSNPQLTGINVKQNASRKAQNISEQDTRYFLPKVGQKDYNVLIDGRNYFDHSFINSIMYENQKNYYWSMISVNDCTTCRLLGYPCFKDNYRLIAIDLNKQQTRDAEGV